LYKMNRHLWAKARLYFRESGAGEVSLKDGALRQEGGGHLSIEKTGLKNLPKSAFMAAAKTSKGSVVGGMTPDGWGIGLYPHWKKIILALLVNQFTLRWLVKRLLKKYKIRQS